MTTVTIQTRIFPDNSQRELLDATISTVLQVCNYLSPILFDNRKIGKTKFHHLVYSDLKSSFPSVPSQLLVRAIGKVHNTYRTNWKTKLLKPVSFSRPSIDYDDHILTKKDSVLSIGTLQGRTIVSFQGPKHRPLERINSNCKLVRSKRNGHYYVYFSVDIEDPKPSEYSDCLGVDFGIVNLASTSDGMVFSGEKTNEIRKRNEELRSRLQSRGSHSAKRHLMRLSGKERRFKRNENHCISKQLVEYAARHGKSIAIEELRGFSGTVSKRKGKPLRNILGKWAFGELRRFVEYKAAERGVVVISVKPQYTSTTCPECGFCDKQNRRTRDKFQCNKCGHEGEADIIAAINIRKRAVVNQPIVAPFGGVTSLQACPVGN